MTFTLDRRSLLKHLGVALGGGAALGTLGLTSRVARAEVAASDLKFLFVFNNGGWDPTTVFAPLFGLPTIDLEPDAQPMEIGGLTLVDSAARPSVRGFFERWHDRTAVINGVSVRSLAHDICQMVALTGDSTGLDPDWATLLADARRTDFTLPHLVLGGPSFSGDRGAAVARAGFSGQLDGLLSGDLWAGSDQEVRLPSPAAERVLDNWMRRRSGARAASATSPKEMVLTADFDEALGRAQDLKGASHDVSFGGAGNIVTQGATAIDALSRGLARSVSLSDPVSWDTHANNTQQSQLFEGLFARLTMLMNMLEATPGERCPTLADETVVVVMSEMGRTPKLNASQGKDHWPYTSFLVVGPGVRGSRAYGGYDPLYNGLLVDPTSGDADEGGVVITAENVGATLLELAGVDSAAVLPGSRALLGMLV